MNQQSGSILFSSDRLKFKLTPIVLFLIGIVVAIVLPLLNGTIVHAQAKTTYWLGVKDGQELSFTVQVPADAAAVILHKDPAPGKGNSTKPRYRTFTHTINGKEIVFHANEIAWETPQLSTGGLTWVVDAGVGADWMECNTKDPLWGGFARGLSALATPFSEGWSQAKVIMVESRENSPLSIRLNLDGTFGEQSPAQVAIQKLTELNAKGSLSEEELNQARKYMLEVANAGRANPDYRRQMGSKVALDLPTGLPPLVLDEKYNNAAQNQADYCAEVKQATHDQTNPKYATLGLRFKEFGIQNGSAEAAGGGSLQNYPTAWMKSDTHYRPWWNLDNQVTTVVGFGIAKGDNGNWYSVAVFGN